MIELNWIDFKREEKHDQKRDCRIHTNPTRYRKLHIISARSSQPRVPGDRPGREPPDTLLAPLAQSGRRLGPILGCSSISAAMAIVRIQSEFKACRDAMLMAGRP